MNLAAPYRMPSPVSPLVSKEGRSLPLVSASLHATAGGGIARAVLEQTFENDADSLLSLTYRMPLPADGAVAGYEFEIGPRVIKGNVEPKHAARERFETAIANGQTAALLEQDRADIFTQEIGNVPPGETIRARITIDMPLKWLPEGEWELRFPTVIGPRFVDNVADAKAVGVTTSPSDIGARIHLELTVRDELLRKVESASHPIEEQNGRWILQPARLDRDIVVRWAVAKPEIGVSLAVARPPREAIHANVAYGLLTIVPPVAKHVKHEARDVIVLLDTSGSMGGLPLEQAKRVVSSLVDSLEEHDRIEMIEFSSSPRAWKRSPELATREVKRDAHAWLEKRTAGGSTEMYNAVIEALKSLRPNVQRQVILVTDGYIGGEQKIVDLCHERLPRSCRLHVVGVGSAVNRALAQALSRAGRGAEVLVALDEDVERATKRLLDRTKAPVLTDLAIGGSGVVEVAPQHVPDLFAGAPVVCAVKLVAEGGKVTVRGTFEGKSWERTLDLRETPCGDGDPAITALFAREHVADLEMRWSIGREVEMIDRTIERVGIAFQIATRMTSWVAVDEVRHDISGSRKVVQPQELPYGTAIDSFGIGDSGMSTRAGSITPEGLALMQRLYSPAPMMRARQSQAPMPGSGAFGGPPMPASAPTKRRRPVVLWFVILLVLFLIALAAWMLLK